MRFFSRIIGFSIFFFLLFSGAIVALADNGEAYRSARFTLYINTNTENSKNGETLPENIAPIAIKTLDKIHDELERVFAFEPEKKIILRFLTPEEFHKSTGAPSWTSAMYFRGEITIPIDKQHTNHDELKSAVRHEYVHAFIAELSDNRAPAWIDEGLAQLIEGEPNPLLGPALREWIETNNAMPLDWLNNGFTTLHDSVVPAAYAQSLFATRTLINRHGFKAIRKYLSLLKAKQPVETAFLEAFDQQQDKFEKNLTGQIKKWANTQKKHP